MHLVRILVFIIILSLVAGFAALNAQPITVNYFLGVQSMPLAVLFAIGFGVGIFVGLLFCAKHLVVLWTRLYSLGRKLKN